MQSQRWIELFRRIPPAQHNILSIVTSSRIEITVQSVLHLEEEYAVIRGRLAGTTEVGRTFFIPYDQINYMNFNNELREAQVLALFGVPDTSASTKMVEILDAPIGLEEQANPEPESAQTLARLTDQPKPHPGIVVPRRSGLIARLRARSEASANPKSGPN